MRKILLLTLLLLLVACGASEAEETKDESAGTNIEPTTVSESAPANQTAPGAADTFTPAKTAADAGVMRDRDWKKGAEEPVITIIEYGDYQ